MPKELVMVGNNDFFSDIWRSLLQNLIKLSLFSNSAITFFYKLVVNSQAHDLVYT